MRLLQNLVLTRNTKCVLRQAVIAHNKIMHFDKCTVSTGSFNFTKSAQKRNAENVLIIKDCKLAQTYRDNWIRRQRVSKKWEE